MNVIHFTFQQTMLLTIPLIIVALGGVFSERNGVVNIALEGVVTMGTFAGILFPNTTGGRTSGQMQLLLTVLISTATGTVFAFFHVYASINMKADQIINGTTLNMFVSAFAVFAARVVQGVQQIQFNNTFRTESVPLLGSILFFGPLLSQNTYITAYLGIAILILSTLMLYQTRFGLRLCSCGKHPQTANAAGIDAYRTQYAGVLMSGVLGGLERLVFAVPTSTNFNADVIGYGPLALAVLIFGQRKPVKVMRVSLFFGLTKAVAAAHSGIPLLTAAEVPSYVYRTIPYVATLVVLISISRNSRTSKASGIPYDKGQRWVDIYVMV